MIERNILLPSKPRIVLEEGFKGIFEIDNLAPGYGHTLGNSLRRIILSSLQGVAITSLKIDGVSHEFSVMEGVKEDVITVLLNLRKLRFKMVGDEATATISVKGPKVVIGADINAGGQVEVLNTDQHIAELTGKVAFDLELKIEKGLGFIAKDQHQSGKMEIGHIAVDALFSPIRRASYEVENMRVGDKTNHNRLRLVIETDGSITPREALEQSVTIMIHQLQSIVGFQVAPIAVEQAPEEAEAEAVETSPEEETKTEDMTDVLKTRIDTLPLSSRILSSLSNANIRTIGGIARKKAEDLLEIDGIGEKGIQEIKKILEGYGIKLK